MSDLYDGSINIETLLPFGEVLRPLIKSSFLSDADLKKFLAKRGIFICSARKEVSIPILTSCLLSPKEFEMLREMQRTKEDSPKRTTERILWSSDQSLVEALTFDKIPYDTLIPEDTHNYTIIGGPLFITDNENELILQYEIERLDKTKDWATHKSTFDGKIVLKRSSQGEMLEIRMEYTSLETKELNRKILNYVIEEFKRNNDISKDSSLEKIRFGEFTNESRIKFLLSLQNDYISLLSFKQVTNIELAPDASQILPPDIVWMQKRVKNFILKGEHLHDTIFLKNPSYHECLIFETMEAKYEFDYRGGKGNCTIEYGFPRYLSTLDHNTQFEIRIINVNLNSEYAHISKRETIRNLLDIFDDMSYKKYQQIKSEMEQKS